MLEDHADHVGAVPAYLFDEGQGAMGRTKAQPHQQRSMHLERILVFLLVEVW
jgi:hypothetical protein